MSKIDCISLIPWWLFIAKKKKKNIFWKFHKTSLNSVGLFVVDLWCRAYPTGILVCGTQTSPISPTCFQVALWLAISLQKPLVRNRHISGKCLFLTSPHFSWSRPFLTLRNTMWLHNDKPNPLHLHNCCDKSLILLKHRLDIFLMIHCVLFLSALSNEVGIQIFKQEKDKTLLFVAHVSYFVSCINVEKSRHWNLAAGSKVDVTLLWSNCHWKHSSWSPILKSTWLKNKAFFASKVVLYMVDCCTISLIMLLLKQSYSSIVNREEMLILL